MRKILYVTGSRAEYGLMREALRRIVADPRLELHVAATGMHLMEKFGKSVELIKHDGFAVSELHATFEEDSAEGVASFLGAFITRFAAAARELEPDLLLLLGDRVEILGAAAAANYLNIPVVHIHGGDITRTADEVARHAITKLAHVHLAATEESAKRIRAMGEEPWRVHTIGSPGVASIKDKKLIGKGELCTRLGLDPEKPLLIVLQHPVSAGTAASDMSMTLDAVAESVSDSGAQVVVIYPNADAGGQAMIIEIEKRRAMPSFVIEKNLEYGTFLGLMAAADAMVGNSSAALIEAPSFGLPVVNIGEREAGRERARNAIDVPQEPDAIRKGIAKALSATFKESLAGMENQYFKEGTFERIIDALVKTEINDALLKKKLVWGG